ncbi:hypothetical protein H4R18_005844 [Coemansia javaensis]|uniref:Uncharacterized protein n=1 Tax=Coemansia javaensis TaxID=2761396 RepID=A0A9W8H188_9FUNG|nr:hypothetical protein H4R18_005844 [Coemansia javaensis]
MARGIAMLPGDVLGRVLERVVERGPWKAGLVLLGVCRAWRACARPLVYRRVWVAAANRRDPHVAARWTSDEDMRMTTNALLALETGSAQLVRRVDVRLVPGARWLEDAAAVLRAMLATSGRWRGVRELALAVDGDQSAGAVDEAGALLARLFPGVVAVVPSALPGDVAGPAYVRMLTERAAHLRRLVWRPRQRLLHTLAFPQLASLDIGLPAGSVVPRVCPQALVSVRVREMPARSVWQLFGAHSCAETVDLPSLQHFHYRAAPAGDADLAGNPAGPVGQLRMPSVRTLRVSAWRRSCLLPAACAVPRGIVCLRIDAADGLVGELAGHAAVSARALVLSAPLPADPGDRVRALASIGRLVGTAQRRGLDTRLRLGGRSHNADLPVAGGAYAHLTSLHVAHGIGITSLLLLLGQAPSLRELRFALAPAEHTLAEVAVPDHTDTKAHPLAPLSTSVCRVHCECVAGACPEWHAQLVQCLLLRLPSLAVFRQSAQGARPRPDFIDRFGHLYPHLGHIRPNPCQPK